MLRFLAGATAVGLGCSVNRSGRPGGSARLAARPGPPTREPLEPGLWPLGIGTRERDGLVLVPRRHNPVRGAALVIALHGAGGRAVRHIAQLRGYAETYGFTVLAPDSYGPTWDAVAGGYGPDVGFIDAALKYTFERCTIDPARIVLEGFSDGASYALGLGLANGDLVTRVVAFSPGFIPPSDTPAHGRPEFFVSHGRQDTVLPVDTTSRVAVVTLRQRGYRVRYIEFDGPHTVPPSVAEAGAQWLVR